MSSSKAKKQKPSKKGGGNKPSKKPARSAHKDKKNASAEVEVSTQGAEAAGEEAASDDAAEAAEVHSDEAAAGGASNEEALRDEGVHASEAGAEIEAASTGAQASDGTEAEPQAEPDGEAVSEEQTVAATAEPGEDEAAIEPPSPSTPVADLPRPAQKRLVESLVFVSDRAINAQQLGRMLKIKSALAKELVDELMTEYEGRGIELVELSGGYQFRSAPSSAHVVREHIAQPPVRLTRAQLETLALVAYRQPITRPEIDDVRGVDSGSALRVLLERGLLKMLGRKDEPGRPLLYGTTPFFLDFFGMRTLKDLPTLREFTELSDENRALFKKKTGESIEEAEAALLAAEEAAQRDSLSAPAIDEGYGADGAAGEGTDPPEVQAGAGDSEAGEEERVADRDLEVEAETFAAGSLQTSPDNGVELEPEGEAGHAEDEEREPPPAPEA